METGSVFCPKCGAEHQKASSYCKGCGEWLGNLRGRPSRIGVIGGQTPEQKIKGLAKNSFVSIFLAFFSAIVVFTSLDRTDSPLFLFVALACFFLGTLQVINFLVSNKMRRDLKKVREAAVAFPGAIRNGQPVLEEFDPEQYPSVTSVTENTTRTLEPAHRNTESS